MKLNLSLILFLMIFVFQSGFGEEKTLDQMISKEEQGLQSSEREKAFIQLETDVNKMLLQIKNNMPEIYKKVWSFNLLEYDFQDIMQTNIQLFNQLISIQEKYRNGLESIKSQYEDTEIKTLEERFQTQTEVLFGKIEKEIEKSVGKTSRQKFPDEMKAQKFMETNFAEIPYFVKLKKVLAAIQDIQKKYEVEYKDLKTNLVKEKESILERRIQAQKERDAQFDIELANLKPEEKKEEGFMDDFWVGIKMGANFSTGSKGGDSKAAPGYGLIVEYTVFRIRPIAFEASVELNLNYIQKPITIPEGTINTDYVNIPVFAKGKWPAHIPVGFGDLTPFIGIGVDPYLKLSSAFKVRDDLGGKSYIFNSKGVNVGFVWNLGGELNILDIGTATLEFRMSLGASSGIPASTIPLSKVDSSFSDVYIPEQRQNGYMIFVGWKMNLDTIFFFF